MATVVAHHPTLRQSPTPPPDPLHLSLGITRPRSAPVPNKFLPFCPPGPASPPQQQSPTTPPNTPPSKNVALGAFSILRQTATYRKVAECPPVYLIDAFTLEAALNEIASHAFPDPKFAFPWLHGLHADNQMQLAFFAARRKPQRDAPKCFRGITIVKAGGDLTKARLKGAIAPDEVLNLSRFNNATFLEVDPREGFSVRNFQIQATKMALVSDIVVYRDSSATEEEVYCLAKDFANAQRTWRLRKRCVDDGDSPIYNTFLLSSSFDEVERTLPDLVAVNSQGQATGHWLDFFQMERREMSNMTKASEIARNVWLGPTPESTLPLPSAKDDLPAFDILIEANDLATPPDPQTLRVVGEESYLSPQAIEFPSSGSMMPQSYPKSGTNPLIKMCQWIHKLANRETTPDASEDETAVDGEGDIRMRPLYPSRRKILIHCADGYTESTLLALAYFMYAERVPAHEAWLRLHCEKQRNFFAYPSDVVLLTALQSRLVPQRSSFVKRGNKDHLQADPAWLPHMDGSLPSRILPYLYLGNLGHANNPDLLKAMGIHQILSVGEPISWTTSQVESWGLENLENVMFIDGVQDNGVDPLMGEFERCLKFIAQGKAKKTATLVHCRVGVSRSATICIAEVMASLGLSFPRAYCYARARRLNVIIQPHLRFAYELLKWDEICQQKRGEPIRREVEWATLCREIAAMNRPYCSK